MASNRPVKNYKQSAQSVCDQRKYVGVAASIPDGLPSKLDTALDQLLSEVEMLANAVNRLGDTLTPVRNGEGPADDSKACDPPADGCPLIETLYGLRRDLTRIYRNISDINGTLVL